MLRKYTAKYFGYPLQDYVKKTSILETLKFLRESQYWEESRIQDYRLEKLKKLISYSYNNVPYYEKLFNTIKLKPSDIKSLKDINKIPILTKEIVRKENMNLVARNHSMKYVKKGKTGGTTGAPIIVLLDVYNRSFTWASYYRWYEWIGVNYYDKTVTFWGERTVLTKPLKNIFIDLTKNLLQNHLLINSFNMSKEDLSQIYKKLIKYKPVVLKGYLSALLDFSSYIESNSLIGLRPKVLSSTSETLLPHHRKYLEKTFNAPIYNQYGCGEVTAIAYECPHNNGLHINLEHVIIEILNDNNTAANQEMGRVIATDLDNLVMPFIRYENGDMATFSSIKCACGINQPLLESVDGRTIDTIALKNGSKVHGVFFTDILYELNVLTDKIQRFQVCQEKVGEIELRLESASGIDNSIRNVLHSTLMKFFEKVEIITLNKLENENNGKFKYIKSINL
ncbi:MAG: phenylacetate--CoA ligase family protein [Sphingobacteriaceae bacterium]|nr:phenylacetate--CoA ligase family protein [Sphingobacteriaceae bacterium]